MADDTQDTTGNDSAADVGHDLEAKRTTAPMSDYSSRAVGIGFLVLLVGAAVAFGVPLGVFGL
ncbi:DUF7550 family protein [Natronobacterium gregoryi]|uniref:Uncharacterized protein n=2 Tax=Natronobacterium gregoryi TaxID=44930 RepID=L0ADV4_NATGS|nr:hypothetical protein [Natronobacterium gregoryi]AFZ71327.1 hypothetical protein Natgr_0058 [Natronobacterium gregoryi SP2]ELY67029.1 hypothetical protein C490_11441 [Natronobacterium gregoryi SP2]PLK18466.1 hypothetical protein CYV19_17855 [Natronobacterium gregoryi SP2]SFJ70357.1 hypothetical protein SAMN05443661_1613 [Natronobacterium gregoryi]